MDKLVCVDTNVLLESPEIINDYNVVVLSHVIRELEKHKLHMNKDLAFRARRATRYLEQHKENVVFDFFDYIVQDMKLDEQYTDNKIIEACLQKNYQLITFDLLLKFKAKGYGIDVIEVKQKHIEDYYGVTDVLVDPDNMDENIQIFFDDIHSNRDIHKNVFDLKLNQYLVLWDKSKPEYDDEGELKGYKLYEQPHKWDGIKHKKLKYKPLRPNGDMLDKQVKPINVKQEMLFDLLQNKEINVKTAFGTFGVGKDFVMISHAVHLLQDYNSGIEKIVWARNNVDLKDTDPIGFLPGEKDSKLLGFAMPLADHLGGVEGLKHMLDNGKVEIQHLADLRGRDIKNAIIYVTEAQNNTKEHIKLLLGRVGEGSQLWLNGDLKQVDRDTFEHNSGLQALKILKGNRLYGQVTLDKIERSDTAKLAELLDEE